MPLPSYRLILPNSEIAQPPAKQRLYHGKFLGYNGGGCNNVCEDSPTLSAIQFILFSLSVRF